MSRSDCIAAKVSSVLTKIHLPKRKSARTAAGSQRKRSVPPGRKEWLSINRVEAVTIPPRTRAQMLRVTNAATTMTASPAACDPISIAVSLPKAMRRVTVNSFVELKPDKIDEKANHRNQSGERGLVVEVRQGNRRCSGDREERKTARSLDGPSGVEVLRIVAVLVLNDARPDPHVGEHQEAEHEHVDDRHEPEGFGVEQPPEHQVARQTQDLSAAVPEHRPERAAPDLRPETFERGRFGRWMHGASFSAHRSPRARSAPSRCGARARETRDRAAPSTRCRRAARGGGERAALAART